MKLDLDSCLIPRYLMVFSPDKRLMASAHGDHNVYVSRVSDGECVRVLSGHPRSPWCVAFHPSRDGILVRKGSRLKSILYHT